MEYEAKFKIGQKVMIPDDTKTGSYDGLYFSTAMTTLKNRVFKITDIIDVEEEYDEENDSYSDEYNIYHLDGIAEVYSFHEDMLTEVKSWKEVLKNDI